jgi:hypothetical protein
MAERLPPLKLAQITWNMYKNQLFEDKHKSSFSCLLTNNKATCLLTNNKATCLLTNIKSQLFVDKQNVSCLLTNIKSQLFVDKLKVSCLLWLLLFVFTCYFKVPNLTLHGIGVDLAHVPTLVRRFDIFDSQLPQVTFSLNDWNSWISCHYTLIHWQNCLSFHFYPGNLKIQYLYVHINKQNNIYFLNGYLRKVVINFSN